MKYSDRAVARLRRRLRDSHALGEWAEAAFLAKAVGLGFIVCRPFRDHHRFDFLLIAPSRKISRVQVKSTWHTYRDRYVISVIMKGRRYRRREIDFVVGYVVPEDAWYVIPVRALGHGSPTVCPHIPFSRGEWERYLEAWHLLLGTRKPRPPTAR